GASEYQVISAKPVTWTVSGASGSGGNLFRAGDTVAILFGTAGADGTGYPLYHPHNKLSGIYNMSAGIQYMGFGTNFPLILGPGQYTFASRAQQYKIIIPDTFAGEEVALTNGVIKVSGYGSAFPAHRSITKKNGVPPNLNASVRTAYFGSLPSFYFRLTDNPSTPENLVATPEAGSETILNLSWSPSRDNGSVDGYMIYANGSFKDYITETGYQLTGLTPGTQYLIEVEAVDNGQLRSAKAQVAARTHDFTAPTEPAALVAAGATETSVTLAWKASTDNSGVVAGYIVYLAGDSVGLAGDTSYTVEGLTVVTAYSFEVAAVDSAGNASAKSAALSVTTPDLTAPGKPGGMMKLNETATSVTLAWTASTDNVGVTGYLVTLNGDSVNFLTQNNVTVDNLPSSYVISVYATDAAGNRSEPAYYSVDNEAPSAPAILAAAPTETSIALLWMSSKDNLVVAGYIVYLNGDSLSVTTDTSYTIVGLTAGTEYALAVAAFDAAGNRSAQATASATTLDLTPPSAPAGLTATPAETSIALSWTPSTDNVGVAGYIVYLNGDSLSIATDTSYTVTGLTAGTEYALAVAAFDAAGNRSAQAAVTASTTPASSTDVQQVGKDAAFAYPNPFGSYLVVEAGAGGEVVIYNLQGQVALRAAVSAGSNRVDVSALPQGTYIVRCGPLTQLLLKK
ncbi:MAG: fibronectin type III domain-containing protein, partial [Prevotellaceae bacterium]|nr:fibronectin type III domain-containing protein [Prevotellaceae bacterium]